jgi:hypothetical protein
MSKILVGSALAVLVVLSQPLGAAAGNPGPPVFSQDDHAIIARNEALRKVVKANPRIVRQILDLIAAYRPADVRAAAPADAAPRPGASLRESKLEFDPKNNPDLEPLPGSSPEATHDLFQLLKKASARPQPKPASK